MMKIQEWPLKSALDPAEYGPQESALTTEIIEREIRGFMTVEEVSKNAHFSSTFRYFRVSKIRKFGLKISCLFLSGN